MSSNIAAPQQVVVPHFPKMAAIPTTPIFLVARNVSVKSTDDLVVLAKSLARDAEACGDGEREEREFWLNGLAVVVEELHGRGEINFDLFK